MAELEGEFAGKLRLPLPPVFSGNPEDWEEWHWNFTIYVSLFDASISELLERAATSDAEILDTHFDMPGFSQERRAELLRFSRKLHVLLANLTSGAAKLVVRQNIRGNGFETWRRLLQKFSMPNAQREHALLAQVLDWKFNAHSFEQDFNAWETVKVRYETLTGTSLPDGVLIATLLNKTSGPLQQHLRLNSTSIRTYPQMREVIVSYFRSRLMLHGTASHTSASSQGPAPMDVGALKGKYGNFKGKKGKGKGFGFKGKGGKGGFGHWNFMKGKGKGGKTGMKGNFKGSGKGKGKEFGGKKGTSGKSNIVCWTCGQSGHTSRECNQQYRVSAIDETSVEDWLGDQDSWQDFGDAWDPSWDETSTWIGAIDDFGWPYSWDDDSWWTSGWSEEPWAYEQAPTSQQQAPQQATSSDTSNQAPVTPTTAQTSADKVSAVTVGEPPGLSLPTAKAKASPKPKASTASGLLLAAVTLGSVTSGSSFCIAPATPMQNTSQAGLHQESTLLETLFTSGLSHLNTSFKDVFFEEHIASLTSVSPEWILFDSGAAAHCCPKNFAREWPLLPLQDRAPPLRSVTGQLLNIYGRRLVGMKIGDVEFHMHFYVTDIPYPIVSVGRLLAQNYTATLGKEMLTLHAPDGKNLPVEREGSLLFLKPEILPFVKQDFELVCVAFHENFSAEAESTVSAFKHVYYHADRWHFDTSRNVLVRYHKRPRKTLFVPSGTSDRPVALNKLAQERKTYVVDVQGNEKELVDNWVTSDEPTRALGYFWKGRTEFKLTTPPSQRPPARLLQKRSLLTPPAQEAPQTSSPAERASVSRAPVATESFRPETSLYPKRSDLQKSLREASDGNEASVRRFVASQLQEPDPSTGLPYEHDFWLDTPLMWIRFHFVPRSTLFVPTEEELQGGPDAMQLGRERMTCLCTSDGDQWREDTWDFESEVSKRDVGFTFTGATCFAKPEEEISDPLPVPEAGEDIVARAPKTLRAPRAPTEQEREEHNLTHLPFRSWCHICVQAKSRQNHSKKLRMKQPVLQCDYSFMSDKGSDAQVTLLNARDVITGMSTSVVVPNKGHSVYAEAELRRFVLDIGRTFGILQCDPEPALKAVAESVTSEIGGLSLRNSPVEWKQAQGAVGQAQALLYSQVRALRLDFAERYDCEVPVTSPLFPWLVKHAQFLLNNFSVRTDGQTPYERRWDRKYTSAVCRFGEVVLFRLPGRVPKAEPAWEHALWLGRETTSDMHVVGNANGVFKTRSVRRLPAENQVSKELLESLKATPWDPRGRQEESANFILPAPQPESSDAVADAQGAQVASDTSGTKRGAETPLEEEPPQLRVRMEPAQGEKRELSADISSSSTKLQRISALVEDVVVDASCVASVTTRDGLEVPVEVNVDRKEELQALRAAEPVVWYDTEFDKEQELLGMQKERESLEHFEVFEEKLVSECSEEQLRNAISTKCVKRPKGDCVRCRLCVRGFDQVIEDPDDTFASTPSLATLKLLLTLACTYNWFVLAGDVSTAFLHALLNDDVFVIPPGEFYPNGGVLWKLRRAMYGLKQSPKAWQLHFASVMADLGFKRLKSDANLYFHPEYKVYLLCYVDDVLLFGAKAPCEHLFAKLQDHLLLRKEGTLQPGESINFLGRCITRREDSIEVSMPTSYVDKILEEYDLLQCKPSPVPGNESLRKKIEAEEPLSAVEHRKYRRIVGQLLWLSSIRPDIQYAVKELSRGLTSPTEDHQAKVKMLLRYLAGSKACVLTLRPRVKLRPEMSSLDVVAYVDSDWAGCVQTRKSTSGVSVFFNGCLIASQSRTQQTIATSSGEAELYSIGLGTSECLFVKSLLIEMNITSRVNIRVFTDSSAGKSMSTRFGASKKTRHVELRFLFMQELVQQGILQVKKVAGTSNPADVLTKYVSREVLQRHLGTLGVGYPFGRLS